MSAEADIVETVDLAEIDLDKAVPCQVLALSFYGMETKEQGCPHPAKWLRTYPCCGGQRTYCDTHMQEIINRDFSTNQWCCGFCDSDAVLGTWRKL